MVRAYPQNGDSQLNNWRFADLEKLLDHYGEEKQTPNGLVNPTINADAAREEFLMFKRLVYQNRSEQQDENTHILRSEELFRAISNSYIANKRGFVQIIPPSWGLSYQFDWHAINRSRR